MRQVRLLPTLTRCLVAIAVATLVAACATAPGGTGLKSAEGKEQTASTAPDAKPETREMVAKREPPLYPSPKLPYRLDLPGATATWASKIIYANTVWSGSILIRQPVTITKTGALTITEGATIYFDIPYKEGDNKTPWLTVRGKLFIRGTEENPVRMSSVFIRHHEDQDVVNAMDAKEVAVDHTIFERAGWGLHIHDTPTEVRAATFIDNYGGARFKSDNISFTGSNFTNNRIGVRLLNTTDAVFTGNSFTDNLTGIFFREGVKTPTIKQNDFDNYEYDIKLGENQTNNIDVGRNWWQNAARGDLQEFIYDGKDSEGVGTIYIAPPADAPFAQEQQ